jgi:hypothetical protein
VDKGNVAYTHKGVLLRNKNKILLFAAKWMEREDIMLGEVSQTQKDKYSRFSFMFRNF